MTLAIVKVNPAEFGIEESKADQMVSGLKPIIEERLILAEQYAEIIRQELTPATMKAARELRLRIRDNRTKGVEKWHKANKEFYLAGGRFVDAIKNKETAENLRMEDALEQIEKHFENLEKQRIAQLQQDREEQLRPFGIDTAAALQLGTMPDDVWEAFYLGQKIKHEERLEAARLAEIERQRQEAVQRLANERKDILMPIWQFVPAVHQQEQWGELTNEAFATILAATKAAKEQYDAEQAAIKAENDRLKAEAEARERQLEAERQLAAKQLEAEKEAARKAAAEAQAAAEEAERKRKAVEAELERQRQAEAEAERQRQAKLEAERKQAEELAKAPIKQQLKVWVDQFTAPAAIVDHAVVAEVTEKFEAFKKWAHSRIDAI